MLSQLLPSTVEAGSTDPGLSYLKAKQKAELRQMKYVLYFKADWCTPCRWMEETTFEDSSFKKALDRDFILVTLDIDAFEGYALKEFFQVYSLPTILVFNSDHEIINRDEGSLSAKSFIELVRNEKKVIKSTQLNAIVNTRPENAYVVETKFPKEKNNLNKEPGDESVLHEDVLQTVSKYGIQIGVFSSYTNARRMQETVSSYTTEPIELITVPNGDKTVYKVFAGKLNSEKKAQILLNSLQNYGLDGIIKTYIAGNKS